MSTAFYEEADRYQRQWVGELQNTPAGLYPQPDGGSLASNIGGRTQVIDLGAAYEPPPPRTFITGDASGMNLRQGGSIWEQAAARFRTAQAARSGENLVPYFQREEQLGIAPQPSSMQNAPYALPEDIDLAGGGNRGPVIGGNNGVGGFPAPDPLELEQYVERRFTEEYGTALYNSPQRPALQKWANQTYGKKTEPVIDRFGSDTGMLRQVDVPITPEVAADYLKATLPPEVVEQAKQEFYEEFGPAALHEASRKRASEILPAEPVGRLEGLANAPVREINRGVRGAAGYGLGAVQAAADLVAGDTYGQNPGAISSAMGGARQGISEQSAEIAASLPQSDAARKGPWYGPQALAEMAAGQAPQLALLMASGGASMPLIFGMEAGAAHDELYQLARKQGLNDAQANQLAIGGATAIGALNTALERLGPFGEFVAKNRSAKTALIGTLRGAGVEGFTEFLQEGTNILAGYGLNLTEPQMADLYRALQAGVGGTLLGGPLGGIQGWMRAGRGEQGQATEQAEATPSAQTAKSAAAPPAQPAQGPAGGPAAATVEAGDRGQGVGERAANNEISEPGGWVPSAETAPAANPNPPAAGLQPRASDTQLDPPADPAQLKREQKQSLLRGARAGEIIHGTDAANLEGIAGGGLQPSELSGSVDAELVPDGGFGGERGSTAVSYAIGRAKQLPVLLILKPQTNRGTPNDGLVGHVAAASEGKSYVAPADIAAVQFPDGRRMPLAQAVEYFKSGGTANLSADSGKMVGGDALAGAGKGIAGNREATREAIGPSDGLGGVSSNPSPQIGSNEQGPGVGGEGQRGDSPAGAELRRRIAQIESHPQFGQPTWIGGKKREEAGRLKKELEQLAAAGRLAASTESGRGGNPPRSPSPKGGYHGSEQIRRQEGRQGDHPEQDAQGRDAQDDQKQGLLNRPSNDTGGVPDRGDSPSVSPSDTQPRPSPPPYTRQRFREDLLELTRARKMRAGPEQVEAAVALADARAATWAKLTGKPAEQWYAEHLAGVSGGKPGEGKSSPEGMLAQDSGEVEENLRRGRAAMEKVIAQKTGVPNAMRRPDVGDISFYWGMPGDPKRKFKGGGGISHIIAGRNAEGGDGPAIARKMVEVIARGTLKTRERTGADPRLLIHHDGHTAVLSLYRLNDRETWLLTGWKDDADEAGEVWTQSGPTQAGPTSSRPGLGAESSPSEKSIDPKPRQVKSKEKESEPDVLPQAKKGAVEFLADGRAILHAFEAADLSTLVHELGHVFRRDLTRLAGETGDAQVKADLAALEQWAGARGGKWSTESEERFARGFERHLREGKTLVKGLERVFEQFKEWLTDIYRQIRGSAIDITLTPAVRQALDRMLGPVSSRPPLRTADGRAATIQTAAGAVPARYAIVEADELLPSHDPITYRPSEDYPPNVQERRYETDREEQSKLARQYQDFKAEFLLTDNPDPVNGPPMALRTGEVMGGNSRAMTVQWIYRKRPAQGRAFAEQVRQAAERFGIDPAAIRQMKQPILVRVLEETAPDTARMRQLVRQLQKGFTQEMSGGDDAASRARALMDDPEALEMLEMLIGDAQSVREALGDPDKTRDLRAWLGRTGVLTRSEISRYADPSTGRFSEEGKRLMERVMLAVVVSDPGLLEGLPAPLVNKLGTNAARLVLPMTQGADWSLASDLSTALEAWHRWKASGLDLEDFLTGGGQQTIQTDPITEPAQQQANWLLRRLAQDSAATWRQRVKEYAGFAAGENAQQQTMSFLPPPANASEAFERAFGAEAMAPEPAMDDVLAQLDQPNKIPGLFAKAMEENPPGRTVGRPQLANPVEEETSRRFVDAVDQARKESGQPQRRSDNEVAAEAKGLLADPRQRRNLQERMNAGESISDVETVAARQIVAETLADLGKATESELLDAAVLVDGYRIGGTEQGRAFRQRRDWHKNPAQRMREFIGQALLTPARGMRQEMRKLDGTPDERAAALAGRREILKQWVKKINGIKRRLEKAGIDLDNLTDAQLKDRVKTAGIIREISIAKADYGDMIYEYWINAILSGTLTQSANLIGNTTNIAIEGVFLRPIMATMNLLVKDKNSPQWSELLPVLRAVPKAMAAAGRNMLLSFRAEQAVFEEGILGEAGTDKLDFAPRAAIPGRAGRIIRTPGRVLRATDEGFKTLIGHLEVYAQAHRTAKAEGFKGEKLEKRMDDLVADLGGPAWEAAVNEGKRLTFQTQLGAFGRYALKSRGMAGAGARALKEASRYNIPFVTTMANIFKMGLRMSPLATPAVTYRLLRQSLSKPAARPYLTQKLMRDVANQLVGAALTALLWELGDDDNELGLPYVTGTMPYKGTQRSERDMAYRTAPPMSIYLLGKYRSYSRIEPLATTLGVIVDGLNAVRNHRRGEDPATAYGRLWKQITIGQIKEKTFAKGLSDIANAIEDEKSATSWLANFTTSWVPNFIRQPARASDPYIREWGGLTLIEKMRYNAFPSADNAPPPKVDVWGREIKKDEGNRPLTDWLYRLTVPINQQKVDVNRLDRLILNYNNDHPNEPYYPSPPTRNFTRFGERFEMTEEEYHDFMIVTGEKAFKYLGELDFNHDQPGEWEIEMIKKRLEQERGWARDELYHARKRGAEAVK